MSPAASFRPHNRTCDFFDLLPRSARTFGTKGCSKRFIGLEAHSMLGKEQQGFGYLVCKGFEFCAAFSSS